MKKPICRGLQRGAVFVESIVVLSFFILCFLGVVYFREVYLAKLRVQRLARASAMAHAMGACSVDPRAGLEKDLSSPPSQAPSPGTPPDVESEEAKKALAARTQNGAPLAEITMVTLKTSASATTKQDQQAQGHEYRTEVGSASFVTCMDPVSNEGIIDVLPRMKSLIEALVK